MNQDELERIKKDIIPVLLKADVKRASIFGSYARGDNTQKSDIDILVDLPRGKTFIDLVELEDNLEEKLKKKVDIVTYDGINPLLKRYILEYQYQVL